MKGFKWSWKKTVTVFWAQQALNAAGHPLLFAPGAFWATLRYLFEAPCSHTSDPEMCRVTWSQGELAYSWRSAWKWCKHGSCQSIRSYKLSCGGWWDLTPRSQLPSLLLTFPPCASGAIFTPTVTGHPERHKKCARPANAPLTYEYKTEWSWRANRRDSFFRKKIEKQQLLQL